MSGGDARQEAEALEAAGDYRAAAARWSALGEHARARGLYVRLFDYGAAAAAARRQGDDLGALELALKGNLLDEAEALRRKLMAELSEGLPRALELFEARAFYLQAAELGESLGQLARAAGLYQKGANPLRAALLLERLGRLREAGEAYEALLRAAPEDARGQLGLGRVLQRFGRHREALPLLLGGMRAASQQEEAARRVACAFFKLDLLEAGRAALSRAGQPPDLDPEALMRALEDELQQGDAQGAGGALEGRYRVERPLGGRFGSSWQGRDLLSGRAVVIRFYPGDEAQNAAFFDELEVIHLAACRGHVRLLEINRGGAFVVSEYHEGDTLRRRLSQAPPLRVGQCRGVILQLFDAVVAAHRAGVLHGALSPTCVRLMPGGACLIDDWGARHLERRMATHTGGPESAFAYRAPELNLGRAADFRADLYSIAALLFRALRGRSPSPGEGGEGWEGWPVGFAAFFSAALAFDPEDRPPTHEGFRRALSALPWDAVAQRALDLPAPEPSASPAQGPRFVAAQELAQGEVVDARDTLLGRAVRLLRLPPPEMRPIQLIDRLHALAGPEQPLLQDILRLDEGAQAIILERLGGVPLRALPAAEAPPLELWLEAADALAQALAAVHVAGVGLGVVDLPRVLWDGQGLRVLIEGALLLDAAQEPARILADARGFWAVVASHPELGGAQGPEALLEALRRRGLLEASAASGLQAQAQAIQGRTMAPWPAWLAALRRALEGGEATP
jgi:tetratricopeptide (TPR) repeat protein